jgi:hypothetical protein
MSACHRGGTHDSGPSDLAAQVRVWVEASCAEQGLAVKVTDSEALSGVAVLLGAAPGKAGGRPAGRPRSKPPDGLEAAGIEAVQAAAAGADDDVVKHSGLNARGTWVRSSEALVESML